jgi:hypothetical protein
VAKVFAALLGCQFIAATPGLRRHAAALGFIRVLQLFLFHWRRHLLMAPIISWKPAICQSSVWIGEADGPPPRRNALNKFSFFFVEQREDRFCLI